MTPPRRTTIAWSRDLAVDRQRPRPIEERAFSVGGFGLVGAEGEKRRSPGRLTDSATAPINQPLSQFGYARIGEQAPLNGSEVFAVEPAELEKCGSGSVTIACAHGWQEVHQHDSAKTFGDRGRHRAEPREGRPLGIAGEAAVVARRDEQQTPLGGKRQSRDQWADFGSMLLARFDENAAVLKAVDAECRAKSASDSASQFRRGEIVFSAKPCQRRSQREGSLCSGA